MKRFIIILSAVVMILQLSNPVCAATYTFLDDYDSTGNIDDVIHLGDNTVANFRRPNPDGLEITFPFDLPAMPSDGETFTIYIDHYQSSANNYNHVYVNDNDLGYLSVSSTHWFTEQFIGNNNILNLNDNTLRIVADEIEGNTDDFEFTNVYLNYTAVPILVDDFEDGEKASFWYLIEENPEDVWLDEMNGRLEGRSSGPAAELDAKYFSHGWRLSADHDFAMQIDWHHSSISSYSCAWLGVHIPGPVDNYIDIDVCYENAKIFAVDGCIEDVEFPWNPIARIATDGTLYIAYDSETDRIYLSINGYWQEENTTNGDWVYEGLVKGTWNVDMLAVNMGFWAQNAVIGSSEVWLDNFQVTQGTLVMVCEGDLDIDDDVDGSDLAELAANNALLDLSVFAAEFGRTDCD